MANIGIIGAGWLMKKWMENRSQNQFHVTTRTGITPIPLSNITKTYAFELPNDQLNLSDWEAMDFIVCSIPFSSRSTMEENAYRADLLINQLSDWHKPVILLSSTSAYPSEKQTYLESDAIELNSITVVEQRFQTLPKVTILRLGGLMGKERFLSKYISNPTTQVVNHIHYEDAFRSIEHVVKSSLWSHTFNVVAPVHPTQEEIVHYQRTYELMKGKREKENRIISSEKLLSTGFHFLHPDPILFK